MFRSPQRQSYLWNSRRTVFDDGLEPVEIHRGLEPVPIAPGLEQIPAEHYRHIGAPQLVLGEEEKETLPQLGHEPFVTRSLLCGIRRKWVWLLVGAALLIITIAVTVPLAIRATRARNNSNLPTPPTPAAPNTPTAQPTTPNTTTGKQASNLSTSGAFNGTGMGLLDLGVGATDLFVWFQDYRGRIRSSELNGIAWRKETQDSDIVVASNVRNATPISAVSYTKDSVMKVHLVYIDSANILQEVIKSNTSDSWVNGPLGLLNLLASRSSSVDLAVCYNDLFYGRSVGTSGGIRLFYGASGTTVQEYAWAVGATSWTAGFTFRDVNGNGGLTCAGAGSGTSYLYLLNTQNQVELWWKDFNTAAVNSTNHPIDVWTRGPAATMAVRTNSPVSYDNYVYFQNPSNNIIGIQPDPKAESSTWKTPFPVGGGVTAVPETRIASTTFFPSAERPSELHIFFQTNGSDITEYLRGEKGGQWSSNTVPVGS